MTGGSGFLERSSGNVVQRDNEVAAEGVLAQLRDVGGWKLEAGGHLVAAETREQIAAGGECGVQVEALDRATGSARDETSWKSLRDAWLGRKSGVLNRVTEQWLKPAPTGMRHE